MEQIYFGQRISALRKEKGMTQEALAQKLGITNQAVSKWESDQCCPDIMQLPALADIFEISMDALFGRTAPLLKAPQPDAEYSAESLPWEDDESLHAVCYVGHRLISFKDIPEEKVRVENIPFHFSFTGFGKQAIQDNDPVILEFSGNVTNIFSDFSVSCRDSEVQGNVQAGDNVQCSNVLGHVKAGDAVTCGAVEGNVQAGDSVTVNGNISGSAQAGGDIQCTGQIGSYATAGGDLQCGNIGGKVQCSGDLECEGNIHGDVSVDGDLECHGDITGNVKSEGDIECQGNINGNVSAEGGIDCNEIYGSDFSD